MQYHLNGFRPGDPSVSDPDIARPTQADAVDVLIIGCGPAGLTLAAQLAQFPGVSVRIAERKAGPLLVGQADGVACRSIEMFAAFGFAEKVVKEAYWVNEVSFWRPDKKIGALARAARMRDVEDDLSEMPHVILSQARLHDFYLEVMRNAPSRLVPDYQHTLISVDRTDDTTHPVTAVFDTPKGKTEIRARYVVGCDGARSEVRTAMGLTLKGEAGRQLWGVMDILATTDFPDIRLKAAIQSADEGSILIIPREGGYMVRMYIELDALHRKERAADRNVTADLLTAKARRILAPYTLEVQEVAWWSAYEIGQRVCDRFDDATDAAAPRIFIAGDACHTHSPKAGQGMNVSMADAFNLGWKLAAVVQGRADPDVLRTYSRERQAKAKELIDFDREMAQLFSARSKDGENAALFQQYFKKHGRYTAGVETRYDPSVIVGHADQQALAAGYEVGMRFHSAPVVRLSDAKPMQMGHVLKADGRWRLIAFAPAQDKGQDDGPVAQLCAFLAKDADSPVRRCTRPDMDIDGVIDLRAVFQHNHVELELGHMPKLLLPAKGRYGLTDYEKIFCADQAPGRDIFEMRGIDRAQGALLIVRPDQFVADVLGLGDYRATTARFSKVLQ